MQLKFKSNVIVPQQVNTTLKVTAVAWSPNGKKLAIVTTDRQIQLFDEHGERKDKFSTKPVERGPKNYIVRQIAFSPQSDKLACAQSDNMVFVYKIGMDWGEKKTICNKYQHSSSITCLVWPEKKFNELFYGLADGSVRMGHLKSQKPTTLYSPESYVTALVNNREGTGIASAHLDGSIFIYYHENPDRGAQLIVRHSCPAFALAWGASISVGGTDGRVVFYDTDGSEEQFFELTTNADGSGKELTAAMSNPTGDAIVFGAFNSLLTFVRNKESMQWEQISTSHIDNLYSVSAMDWRSDGDCLAVGNIVGSVDMYEVSVKRALYKGGFEMTYVSHSQVIVRHLETNLKFVARSNYGKEILKTNIYKNRFVIAHTSETLLLGDLHTLKLSEIPWTSHSSEKFYFDNPSACIIFLLGELYVVEYGAEEVLGSVRTSFVSSHVVSLRINERPLHKGNNAANAVGSSALQHGHGNIASVGHHGSNNSANNNAGGATDYQNKKLAFLLDAQTICVKDLVQSVTVHIPHDSKIDWLELNARADLLLFRDKRRYLHLFDVNLQVRKQLINFCTYVQWVPGSDVIVAQNRNSLCVWYNVSAPDQIAIQPIKGDVEDIELVDNRTEVIVDEGISQAIYRLDESLISFSTAIDDHDLYRAMDILDKLYVSPDVEAMWKQLKTVSLSAGEIKIAQRCCAAVGDIATGKFLGTIAAIGKQAEQELGILPAEHYLVRCKLALLHKDWLGAEMILLNQGKIDECIDMYQKLLRHDDAIRVAQENKHPDVIEMRQAYFQYLLDTNQYEKAASMKAQELDFLQAINLFLKGGLPGRAAQVVLDHDLQQPMQMLDTIATALTRAGMHDKAGEFYERLNEYQRALDSYMRGNAYRKAVDLARKCFPGKVVELQEMWGDYLVSIKQIDMAINHYIEAKNNRKAIEAALNARQYPRALQLVDAIDRGSAKPYYRQLARHYEENQSYPLAERCYVSADLAQYAVEMHAKLGNWELAHSIAKKYMREEDVSLLYINQAQKLENKGRLKDAEKMYLAVKEKDLAINMYKKHRRYDDMIRLVTEYRPELLKETHQFLAITLEMEGAFKDAEHHYVEAQEWHSAVNMYRNNEMWDDAIRVAKFHGGIGACKRVTIALLMSVGVLDGTKFLTKHGLVEAAIDHAAENGAFDLAYELCNHILPKKLPDVYLKHALLLEEDEKYDQAEEAFLKANKPREAIDMYLHQRNWLSALRVAEQADVAAIPLVYIEQAKVTMEVKDYSKAEELYLAASRPDLALQMYQELEQWSEALRIAQKHLPHRVGELNAMYNTLQAKSGRAASMIAHGSNGGAGGGGGGGAKNSDFLGVGRSLEQAKQWSQAVDIYLNATKVANGASKQDLASLPYDPQEIWERAVDIARNHLPNRYVEVAVEVSKRLTGLKKEEIAADLLFEIGRQEESITLLLTAKKFDKAKNLAKGNISLKRRVDEAYQSHLVTREDTKELVELGQSDVAIDVLARRGDWTRVWEVIAKESVSTSTWSKYVLMRCDELITKGDSKSLDEAVTTLARQIAPSTDAALATYGQLVNKLLAKGAPEEHAHEYQMTISSLRDVLYSVASSKRSPDKKYHAELLNLLMAVHYQNILYTARKLGLKDIAAKCSVTLLRYLAYLPADKAFYQAGILCREQGNINLAFMLLNRYVDIAEGIDTADISLVDNADFTETDAIPPIDHLPPKHYLADEDDREEVRTWVLSVVTDAAIEQRFPSREKSRNTLYEGLYRSDKAICIVTGYPIYSADMLEVNNSSANRRDWNLLVNKTRIDPWTGEPQNPIF